MAGATAPAKSGRCTPAEQPAGRVFNSGSVTSGWAAPASVRRSALLRRSPCSLLLTCSTLFPGSTLHPALFPCSIPPPRPALGSISKASPILQHDLSGPWHEALNQLWARRKRGSSTHLSASRYELPSGRALSQARLVQSRGPGRTWQVALGTAAGRRQCSALAPLQNESRAGQRGGRQAVAPAVKIRRSDGRCVATISLPPSARSRWFHGPGTWWVEENVPIAVAHRLDD